MTKEVITCSCCGKEKMEAHFYASQSYIYKHTGKLSVCKECLWDYVIDENGNTDVVKMKDILQSLDKPFVSSLLEASEEESKKGNKNIFKIYMKNLGLRQNRHLRWSDSDGLDTTVSSHVNNPTLTNTLTNNIQISEEDKEEMVKFWGKGFDLESYLWLQNEFEDFISRYECDSKGMELLIKQICLTQLDIQNGRASKQKVDTQLKTLQDLLGSSNLKPVQETGANSVEQETFGTLIKKYENEKPIPEADPQWKDVDGISKYVKVFFLGHLTRMLGLKNDYADEYWEEMNKYTVKEPVSESEDGDDNGLS